MLQALDDRPKPKFVTGTPGQASAADLKAAKLVVDGIIEDVRKVETGERPGMNVAPFRNNLVNRLMTIARNQPDIIQGILDYTRKRQTSLNRPLLGPNNNVWKLEETAKARAAEAPPKGTLSTARQTVRLASAPSTAEIRIRRSPIYTYIHIYASGTVYVGVGGYYRAQETRREKEKKYKDPYVRTILIEAPNEREAYKEESRQIDAYGGIRSKQNYNITESKGRNFRRKDGEKL